MDVDQTRILARYAVYNPSFRLAFGLLHHVSTTPSFDRFLRANTSLTQQVEPIDIDLVSGLSALPKDPKPLIFLFVIDSLRPDYLGSYNPAVRFTPRLDDFASESVVFRNAFTRYGGTGLSVPAIWAGSAIVHKQYVQPFHPMNTLEKLLDANGYRLFLGLDSIMQQLLVRSDSIDELDPGVATMDYQFCGTLGQIESKLASTDISIPVFAYSLPQDVHMSRLPRTVEAGPEYQSFHAPYATKVHAIDACFGRFIDFLKRRGLYERSLVILTADHGEMLGEDGRFGHSYHLFPQVIQVPLIVHLPAALDRAASVGCRRGQPDDRHHTDHLRRPRLQPGPRESSDRPVARGHRRSRIQGPAARARRHCGQLRRGVRGSAAQWSPALHCRRDQGGRSRVRTRSLRTLDRDRGLEGVSDRQSIHHSPAPR